MSTSLAVWTKTIEICKFSRSRRWAEECLSKDKEIYNLSRANLQICLLTYCILLTISWTWEESQNNKEMFFFFGKKKKIWKGWLRISFEVSSYQQLYPLLTCRSTCNYTENVNIIYVPNSHEKVLLCVEKRLRWFAIIINY